MSTEDDDLIEQNSEEIDMEDDNEGKVAIVEEVVELSEPGRIVRDEVTRIENPRELDEEGEEESRVILLKIWDILLNNWKNKPIKYKNWQIRSRHYKCMFEANLRCYKIFNRS
jgi:hypothetical protein